MIPMEERQFKYPIGTNEIHVLPYARRWHLDATRKCACPQCHQDFVLQEGRIYPTFYKNTQGTSVFGHLPFCSDLCILGWVEGHECGSA